MTTIECANLSMLDKSQVPHNATEKLLKKLNKLELSISLADNEFNLMYDKVFKPCIIKNNLLNSFSTSQNAEYEKKYFIEFMKSKSKSYFNMINYKKILNDKLNKKL